jgi:hypothetical protein
MIAAIHGPTMGMKRKAVAIVPHSIAFGTPIKNKPIATTKPKIELTTNCINRKRLTRLVASSSALVVRLI